MLAWIHPFDLARAALAMAACAAAFAAVAVVFKGARGAWASAKRAAGETRINLWLGVLDRLFVTPLVVVFVAAAAAWLARQGLRLAPAGLWDGAGRWPTILAAVVAGDFVGYWRHRLQHSRLLWPAHAIHHSDRELTWLTLERMHPIDRLGTALDAVILAALGFPVWALAANTLVRHYYGYFIHADLPWTYGRASLIFNSPAMHRWHHAREIDGSGSNFATVFAVWDRLFGTFHQPGPCDVPLGVREHLGEGVAGQYLHPFKAWWAALRPRRTASA